MIVVTPAHHIALVADIVVDHRSVEDSLAEDEVDEVVEEVGNLYLI
jgi:hypothetical protein